MTMTPTRGPRPNLRGSTSEISPTKKIAIEDNGASTATGFLPGSEVYVPSMEEIHHYGKNVYRFAEQVNADVIRFFNYIPDDVKMQVKQMFWEYVHGQLQRNQPQAQQARHQMAQIGEMAHNTWVDSQRDRPLIRMDDVNTLEQIGQYLTIGNGGVGDST